MKLSAILFGGRPHLTKRLQTPGWLAIIDKETGETLVEVNKSAVMIDDNKIVLPTLLFTS